MNDCITGYQASLRRQSRAVNIVKIERKLKSEGFATTAAKQRECSVLSKHVFFERFRPIVTIKSCRIVGGQVLVIHIINKGEEWWGGGMPRTCF